MEKNKKPFWNISSSELLTKLHTNEKGLTSNEAEERLARYGPNLLKPKKRASPAFIFLSQFKSPILLIMLFTSIMAFFLGDTFESLIIIIILFISSFIGFLQEKRATNAIGKLLAIVHIKAAVFRDGEKNEILIENIVPGDIVYLSAGNIVPGDCLILESKDLFVNEANLTGETYPVEKKVGIINAEAQISQRTNSLFMGTNIVSGSAKAAVIYTGIKTIFGKISERLKLRAPETEFEHGTRRFGYFLIEITLILVIAIFAINVYFSRPIIDSILFALALAVGISPQLLPAIISVTLAKGAKDLVKQKVIVKKLFSVENFGSMNVLCSDKTGTLTEGVMQVHSAVDINGNNDKKVLLYAYLNAFYESGYANPIDDAIRALKDIDITGYQKIDEVPYDFIRKRLSILISKDNNYLLISKGTVPNLLEACSLAETSNGKIANIKNVLDQIQKDFKELSAKGFRVLGLAYKKIDSAVEITKDSEIDMIFIGFLVLFDPPKMGIMETINQLKNLGISLKIITGDNQLVATYVGQQVGFSNPKVITGPHLRQMSDEALINLVNDIDIFAEVEPNQKERIILALKKVGNVVGYMGDGINDASALHVADVGISVDNAVDVAKEAADIVLLEKNLEVLVQGVREGRKIFRNTIKYVRSTTSANFGNMFSMAGASLFLPFLPMLPEQILLTNLLTDLPLMAIATDNVDQEMIDKPKRWNIKFIRQFMLVFGIVSSIFDFITFGVLIFLLHATQEQFQTGWFFISVITELLITFVVRTQKLFFRSKPGRYLLVGTFIILVTTILLIYLPLGAITKFVLLPPAFILIFVGITVLYFIVTEIVKKIFYKIIHF